MQPSVAAASVVVESKVTVIGWFAGNPEPVMEIAVAVEPATTPMLGVTVTDAIVVVKLVVAVLKPDPVTVTG